MKKKFLISIIISLFIYIPNIVHAESTCSYSELAELNRLAGNVKASYEAKREIVGTRIDDNYPLEELDVYESVIELTILNITDDIYIRVTNDQNNKVLTYYKKDTEDGVITFRQDYVDKITNYTIEVYSNKFSCAEELLRTFNLQTPMYNPYSELYTCTNNPEFYYCQEFIATENISYNEFHDQITDYKIKNKKEKTKEEKKKTIGEKIKEFYQDHTITINIVGSVVVIIGVAITVILVKKRRGRVI